MDTTSPNADGAPRRDEAAAFWRACATLRAGDLAADLEPMLRLAWASSPALRVRLRTH
ncbi:hypothetical protein [Neoroseomonas oryzicola]|uniref:hypothetical protein n=1 Tax=Neoroseomonas oryzicola TaxID=535904 RepID=UPI00143C272A|nr:hypothetical protein [Neoroseomonas oryzicola]